MVLHTKLPAFDFFLGFYLSCIMTRCSGFSNLPHADHEYTIEDTKSRISRKSDEC